MAAMRVETRGAGAGTDVRAAMANVERSVRRYSRNDSEDLVQEALARAVKNGVECDAEPWLRTVARRIAIDRSRSAREFAAGGSDELDVLPQKAGGASPEDIVLSNEGVSLLGEAMGSMPARYRDALLTYAEDQQPSSVSERFGISAAATWTLLCRARARLRQELVRVGYAFSGIAAPLHRFTVEASTAAVAGSMVIATAIGAPHAVVRAATPATKHVATVAQHAAAPASVVHVSTSKDAALVPSVALPVQAPPAPAVPPVASAAPHACTVTAVLAPVKKVAGAVTTLLPSLAPKTEQPAASTPHCR